jgi:hypothetical protein
MSVENTKVIDVVSIDLDGNAILSISDHLEWDDKNEHLLILQDKINAYLDAIESGNLYKVFPNAKDRKIIIRIVAMYEPNSDVLIFLKRTEEILKSAGYGFGFKVLKN